MRRITKVTWIWIQVMVERVDSWVLDNLRMRATLIAALIGTAFLIWGIVTHNPNLGIEVILAGAMGYLIGFVPAVGGGLLITAIHFFSSGMPLESFPVIVIQIMGYTYIAWLGRQHKHLAIERRNKLADVDHDAKVVSWSFVNEVRNSLLAMRLLLFVKQNEATQHAQLRMIEDELLRLESLFGKLDDSK